MNVSLRRIIAVAAVLYAPSTYAASPLTVTALSSFEIKVQFTLLAGGNEYIFRSMNKTGPFTAIAVVGASSPTTFVDNFEIEPGGTYYYYGMSALGSATGTLCVTTPPNTPAMGALEVPVPTNLTYQLLPYGDLELSWTNGNSAQITGAYIERSLDGVTWTEIGYTNFGQQPTEQTAGFIDGTGAVDTFYYYRVAAYEGYSTNLRVSAWSDPVSTFKPTKPPAPTNVRVIAKTSGSVELAWSNNSRILWGVDIMRRKGTSGPFNAVGGFGMPSPAPATSTWTDTVDIQPGTVYEYYIYSYIDDLWTPSAIIAVKTPL
jgi:hypothetical protein